MRATAADIIKCGRRLQYSCAVYWATYLLLKAEEVQLYLRSLPSAFFCQHDSTARYIRVL